MLAEISWPPDPSAVCCSDSREETKLRSSQKKGKFKGGLEEKLIKNVQNSHLVPCIPAVLVTLEVLPELPSLTGMGFLSSCRQVDGFFSETFYFELIP